MLLTPAIVGRSPESTPTALKMLYDDSHSLPCAAQAAFHCRMSRRECRHGPSNLIAHVANQDGWRHVKAEIPASGEIPELRKMIHNWQGCKLTEPFRPESAIKCGMRTEVNTNEKMGDREVLTKILPLRPLRDL